MDELRVMIVETFGIILVGSALALVVFAVFRKTRPSRRLALLILLLLVAYFALGTVLITAVHVAANWQRIQYPHPTDVDVWVELSTSTRLLLPLSVCLGGIAASIVRVRVRRRRLTSASS